MLNVSKTSVYSLYHLPSLTLLAEICMIYRHLISKKDIITNYIVTYSAERGIRTESKFTLLIYVVHLSIPLVSRSG